MTEKDLARKILLEEITELLTDYEVTYDEPIRCLVSFQGQYIALAWDGEKFGTSAPYNPWGHVPMPDKDAR